MKVVVSLICYLIPLCSSKISKYNHKGRKVTFSFYDHSSFFFFLTVHFLIPEGQIVQVPKEKEQKDKQWSSKHYTEKLNIEQHETHYKTDSQSRCSGRVKVGAPER